MDPEKPPRRRKSGETPVTIDLEAVPAAEDSKPAEPAPETADTFTAASAEDAAVAESTDQSPPVNELPEPEPARSWQDEPSPDVPPATAHGPNKSGALAAAILGGLVALAGAGALQYGGFLPSLAPDGKGVDLAPVNTEIDSLKTSLAQLQSRATPVADLQPIESRLASLERAVADGAASIQPSGVYEQSISTLEASVAKLNADLTALRDQATAAERNASDQSAQLTERLDVAEQKLQEPRNDVAMARAVAASALKTAIDRGGPYLAELDAFASVAPDDPAIAALKGRAATGVPSRSDLVRDFQPIADQMIEAVHQPSGDQGIIDRLISSASSAIKIRPVGSVEGDTPEAVVARIEDKLQNGDFKGAQIEWQALPETARNAGASFKATLDERIAVEEGVNAIVSGALSPSGNQS